METPVVMGEGEGGCKGTKKGQGQEETDTPDIACQTFLFSLEMPHNSCLGTGASWGHLLFTY